MCSNWNWKLVKKGKVRDVYEDATGEHIALVASDRVSAFDHILPVEIEDKGKILTKISAFWCDQIEEEIKDENSIKSAFITIENDHISPFFQKSEFAGRTTIMRKLRMLPIEAIVRGHITGSIWKAYEKGEREFCGVGLEDGLKNADQLKEPLFTPTTKAPEGEHDENITFTDMINILDGAGYENPTNLAENVRHYSLLLYNFAYDYARMRNIILADTKLEFGVDRDGILYVADELFTPDSSRFWPESDYEPGHDQPSMDKQIIRDYIAAHEGLTEIPEEVLAETKAQYEKVYEMLTRT